MRVGGTMTTYCIYMATHPDGSRYYGLTTKGLKYAKELYNTGNLNINTEANCTAAEWFAIGKLIDPYINCKTGKCARGETLAIQNAIRLIYENCNKNG